VVSNQTNHLVLNEVVRESLSVVNPGVDLSAISRMCCLFEDQQFPGLTLVKSLGSDT